MRLLLPLAILALLVTAGLAGAVGASHLGPGRITADASATTPVAGNITGPKVLAYNANKFLGINGTGGPAIAANGTQVGNITFYASVTGVNTTGVSLSPTESGILNGTPQQTLLTVGNVTEALTILVEITSTFGSANESINLTYTVNVVQPYTLSMTILSTTSSTILAFSLTVDLDGAPVGSISVPTLTGHSSYVATFQYATLGLSSGDHTFTVSLVNEHGLVAFAGGGTTYSTTFYVPGPPPNYTLWYLAGAVAFFGAVFIFVTRVAARRRTPARK